MDAADSFGSLDEALAAMSSVKRWPIARVVPARHRDRLRGLGAHAPRHHPFAEAVPDDRADRPRLESPIRMEAVRLHRPDADTRSVTRALRRCARAVGRAGSRAAVAARRSQRQQRTAAASLRPAAVAQRRHRDRPGDPRDRAGPPALHPLPPRAVRHPVDGAPGDGLHPHDGRPGVADLPRRGAVPRPVDRIMVRRADGAGARFGPDAGPHDAGLDAGRPQSPRRGSRASELEPTPQTQWAERLQELRERAGRAGSADPHQFADGSCRRAAHGSPRCCPTCRPRRRCANCARSTCSYAAIDPTSRWERPRAEDPDRRRPCPGLEDALASSR